MPQAIYSSLYRVGQLESKILLTVKDGCPVCYVLQWTSQYERASFPKFHTCQIMGMALVQDIVKAASAPL